MSTSAAPRRPLHLWIVSILSLLWNSIGPFDYVMTQFKVAAYLKNFTPEQLAWVESFPAWAVAGWAFGVWGAFAGSLALLFRRAWAVWAFAISLAGLAVATLYQFGISNAAEMMGQAAVVMNAVIWVVAIALLWYSIRQRSRGILL